MSTPGGLLTLEKPEVFEPQDEEKAGSSLATAWRHMDPVDGVIEQLECLGRVREADMVKAVLAHALDDAIDERAIRAYVSSVWAEDWDSEEDAVYDRM